MYIKPIES